MIIWGSKVQEKEVSGGTFFCPNCKNNQSYQQRRVANYFTLYFISLFETEDLGDYVLCGGCGGRLNSGVLALSQVEIEALMAPWLCSSCGNRNPNDYVNCISCNASKSPTTALPAQPESRMLDSDERFRPPSSVVGISASTPDDEPLPLASSPLENPDVEFSDDHYRPPPEAHSAQDRFDLSDDFCNDATPHDKF